MIGVLAIQGNFSSHIQILNKLGYDSKLVKSSKDLDDIDGLIIPGGESTTMTKLIARENRFAKSIKSFSKEHPILGTCAGLILMSKNSFDDKVINFGIIDIESERIIEETLDHDTWSYDKLKNWQEEKLLKILRKQFFTLINMELCIQTA